MIYVDPRLFAGTNRGKSSNIQLFFNVLAMTPRDFLFDAMIALPVRRLAAIRRSYLWR